MPATARWLLLAASAAASLAVGASARGANPEIFPGATLDQGETAALSPVAGPVAVYRTDYPFGIVLNYYRFKRKQAVHVVQEGDLGRRFLNIAAALERPDPARALLLEPIVQRFHQRLFGRVDVEGRRAAAAWRELARRHAGHPQLVGEGERVTLYRPYLSQRTFELIDETVIVLRIPGGKRNERQTPTGGPDRPPGDAPDRTGARADR